MAYRPPKRIIVLLTHKEEEYKKMIGNINITKLQVRRILRRIDKARRMRAVEAVAKKKMVVRVWDGAEDKQGWMRAGVSSGEKDYGVQIGTVVAECNCADYLQRRVYCKHIAAVCYMVIKNLSCAVSTIPIIP